MNTKLSQKSKNLYFFLLLPALFIQLLGALFYFIFFQGTEFARLLYGITKIIMVAYPLLWLYLSQPLKKLQAPAHRQSISKGLIFGILASILILTVYISFPDYFSQFQPQLIAQARSLKILQHYILFAIFLSFFHSLFEEYYWRWFVFRALHTKFPLQTSALLSSLAFASHHLIIISQFFPLPLATFFTLAVMLGGWFWSYLYAEKGSLLGPWLSHAAIDIAIMSAGYMIIFR